MTDKEAALGLIVFRLHRSRENKASWKGSSRGNRRKVATPDTETEFREEINNTHKAPTKNNAKMLINKKGKVIKKHANVLIRAEVAQK
jgi:hypothetical protein